VYQKKKQETGGISPCPLMQCNDWKAYPFFQLRIYNGNADRISATVSVVFASIMRSC